MIHARSLTRNFTVKRETVPAVRGIDLDVEPGQLVAILGPNGAGKSTTLRMLTTLLPPSSGTANVAGHEITTAPGQVRARIGYVGQHTSIGENFRVRDELVTQGEAYGFPLGEARRRADAALTQLELRALAKRKPGTLSGGQSRRVDVAMGLIHQPRLLFLDEPSTGLDPQNRANVWEHVLRLRREHAMTLVLTTHYLDEADSMAERVVIIDHGRVIADGSPGELKQNHAGDHIHLTTHDETAAAQAAEVAARMPGTQTVNRDGCAVQLRIAHASAALPEYLRALEAANIKVATAETSQPTLDDVFLALTGRSLREDESHHEDGDVT